MKKKSLLLTVLLVSLTACGSKPKPTSSASSNGSSESSYIESSSSETSTSVFTPYLKGIKIEPQGHFTGPQTKYLGSGQYADTAPYSGNLSVSKPLPIKISWDTNVEGPLTVRFVYSEGPLASIEESFEYQTTTNSFDFYNAEFEKDYIVKIYKGNQLLGTGGPFKETLSVAGPRSLYVDGVENFRDIGGWGKFVNDEYKPYMRQGMLYRSGRFNADKEDPINITISQDGIDEINNHLKIKTEIDLRRTSTNEVGSLTDRSVLGGNVNYVQIPLAFGGNNILTFKGKLSNDDYQYDNPKAIKEFFEILAVRDNYPINFHCSLGKDRTGCLAYLIEGLLGFDQEDACRDYMFTNYSDAGMCKMTDITDRYGQTIEKYENGENFQEKVYNYLHEVIGLSTRTLDSIIDLLKV